MSFVTSCSQSRTTVQPIALSSFRFRASLRQVALILASHFSDSLSRHSLKRHPCQKSPSTNTATMAPRNTRSGRPGRSGTWLSHSSPSAAMAAATAFSGPVFFPLILAMTALRFSGDIMSPRCRRHFTPCVVPEEDLSLVWIMWIEFSLLDDFKKNGPVKRSNRSQARIGFNHGRFPALW